MAPRVVEYQAILPRGDASGGPAPTFTQEVPVSTTVIRKAVEATNSSVMAAIRPFECAECKRPAKKNVNNISSYLHQEPPFIVDQVLPCCSAACEAAIRAAMARIVASAMPGVPNLSRR